MDEETGLEADLVALASTVGRGFTEPSARSLGGRQIPEAPRKKTPQSVTHIALHSARGNSCYFEFSLFARDPSICSGPIVVNGCF